MGTTTRVLLEHDLYILPKEKKLLFGCVNASWPNSALSISVSAIVNGLFGFNRTAGRPWPCDNEISE
jgi:hypothetical protein